MKVYLSHVLKNDTSGGDMDEKVDHWFYSFEKFHKKYILMPSLSLKTLFIEESLSVTVWSTLVFIGQENETWCYLNAMFKILYFKVFFEN